ncbi:ribosome silencing factor [bacterium]|nr:ribosome silencing factor [bacterium]
MKKNNEVFLEDIIKVCEDKQAKEIKVYKLKDDFLADFLLILSANNFIHCKAISNDILATAKKFQEKYAGSEINCSPNVSGKPDSGWLIIDFNVFMVHIFIKDLRDYYKLDDFLENKAVIFHY